FNFQGGNNVFVNAGTTTVGLNPVLSGGSRFLLTSLTTFNNSGTLQMTNGVVGDSIVAAGSRYVGSGGARLAIDAQVGAPGSVADTLTVGVSSGRTAVLITDRTTGYGSFNPGGVRIVTGTTHAGDFVLDAGSTGYNPTLFGGAIDKPGLFFSQLAVDGSGNTVLASAPKEQVYQVATLGAQVQALWYGTERSPNRQADLRDGLAGGDDGEGPQSGLWMDIKGLTASRDVTDSFAALGTTYQYDASYSQDMRSVMIGLDSVHLSSRGGLVVGGSLGYVRSDADFDRQSSTSQLEGIVANGYATLLAGDMFVAGTVGVSGMNARVVAPTLTGYTRQVTDINTVGGSLEAGVRKPFILGSTIEPSLSFTY
ncbi:MAG: autotransporter domain-containing protein, partial [Reyranella sp.]|nr:autotransporter domain-containing protein [Reyranella sp.]